MSGRKTALAAILVVAGMANGGCAHRCEHTSSIAFASRPWRVDAAECGTRAAMAEDLVRKRLLIGLTARSVRTLLGSPDEVQGRVWTYELTPRLESNLPDFLDVRFGANRRVLAARTALAGAP